MIATRSPGRTVRTSGPTSTTSPENSWPRIWGFWAPVSGCGSEGVTIGPATNSCRSVPQMPTVRGRTRISCPVRAPGSGTSSTRMSRLAWNRTARMSSATLRPSGGLVGLLGDVTGLFEAGRARVVPEHDRRLGLRRVAEAVVVVARHVDAVAGAHLDVVLADAGDALARDDVLDLLTALVAVDLVAAARREVGDAEHRLLGAHRLPRDQPADVHVDPAGLARLGLVGLARPEVVDVHHVAVLVDDGAVDLQGHAVLSMVGRPSGRGGDAEALADVGDDGLRAGQERVLQRGAVRDRRVGGRQAPPVVEVLEGLLDERRQDAARPAAGARTLFDDEEAVGLGDRGQHRRLVQRTQRAQVDDLELDAVAGQDVGRGQDVVHAL